MISPRPRNIYLYLITISKLLLFFFFNNHHILFESKIVIPFSTYNNPNSNPNSFIINYSEDFLYTEITSGQYNSFPSGKKLAVFFSFRNSKFVISPREVCPSTSLYNVTDSVSYKYKDGLSHDTFYFYDDIKVTSLKRIEDITFKYSNFTINKANKALCGDMGFNIITKAEKEEENLVSNLKNKNYIEEYYISFKFDNIKPFDNYENLKGKIIIGEQPHIYDKNKYDLEQYIQENIFKESNLLDMYQLKFDKIFLGLKNNIKTSLLEDEDENEKILLKFEINYGLISGPDVYKDYIEKNFFNKSEIKTLCDKSSDSSSLINYDIFVCDSDIKAKFDLFPEIIFFSKKFEYNFTFTYEDLFMLKNNKYYFKIIFVGGGYDIWRLGLPFLSKYNLVFNQDKKTIGFYNENIYVNKNDKNKNKNNTNILKKAYFWVVLFVIIVIIIISTVFVMKYFFGKNVSRN